MDERPSDKSLGVFGTIVFQLLLLLALIFISISSVDLGDEGILVALGDSPTGQGQFTPDRKSTRLNSSHVKISYAVFCLKKKNFSDLVMPSPLLQPLTDISYDTLPP